jgi:hypothetical protein
MLRNAKSIKACFCRRGEKSFALTMRYVAEQSFRAKKRAFIWITFLIASQKYLHECFAFIFIQNKHLICQYGKNRLIHKRILPAKTPSKRRFFKLLIINHFTIKTWVAGEWYFLRNILKKKHLKHLRNSAYTQSSHNEQIWKVWILCDGHIISTIIFSILT